MNIGKQTKWILGAGIGFSILFCTSFVYFYSKYQRRPQPATTAIVKIGDRLPQTKLINLSGSELDYQTLSKGKIILALVTPECSPCQTESQFLKTVVGRRNDLAFYGVVSFGEKSVALESAEKIFPFKMFYDEGFRLAGGLGLTQVPIKIFLEDGIIKKVWGGATTEDQKKEAFIQWMDELE